MKSIPTSALLLICVHAFASVPTLEQLQDQLADAPNKPSALYNLGLLHYLSNNYSEAIPPWKKLKSLDPEDWQLRTKLIQAYSASGKIEEREAEITELRTLRASGKIQALSKAPFFIRDQFQINDIRIYVFDYYDMDANWHMGPLLWKFRPNRDGHALDWFISLGSYDGTTEFMRSTGQIGNKDRAYHLDGYWASGTHRTFELYNKKPDYDRIKEHVIEILSRRLNEEPSHLQKSGVQSKELAPE